MICDWQVHIPANLCGLSEQDDAFNSFQHCGEFSMLTQSSAAIIAHVPHRMEEYGLSAADPAAAVSPHTSQKHNIEHAMNGMAISDE